MSATCCPEETERLLESLVAVSREFGSDQAYVLAGGGNTSVKAGDVLYVKASGTRLGTIDRDGFVPLSRSALDAIWSKAYPDNDGERESAVLADLNAARIVSGDERRPSVESLLHGLFPQRYVVHTHPALVNGVTCSREAEAAARRLMGDGIVWVPVIDPGYTLARFVREAAFECVRRTGAFPTVVALQNHGVFVAGESPEEIRERYGTLIASISACVEERPAPPSDLKNPELLSLADRIKAELPGSHCSAFTSADLVRLSSAPESLKDLAFAVTPDHIVYFGYRILTVGSVNGVGEAIRAFEAREGFPPRIVLLRGVGSVAVHATEGRVAEARALFEDQVRIAVYARSFGGLSPMPKANVDFIRTWEAEKYRAAKSS